MITEAQYSRHAMKQMMDVLPYGTTRDIAKQLNLTKSKVENVIYGKQYDREVIVEVERRFNKVRKELSK